MTGVRRSFRELPKRMAFLSAVELFRSSPKKISVGF